MYKVIYTTTKTRHDYVCPTIEEASDLVEEIKLRMIATDRVQIINRETKAIIYSY